MDATPRTPMQPDQNTFAMNEHFSPEGRPLTAKELRRTAKARAAIEQWDATQPAPKPDYVRGWVITEATGIPIEQLAPALRQLGWVRIAYREHRGQPRLYWLRPGALSPVRAVGRPPGKSNNPMLPGDREASAGPRP